MSQDQARDIASQANHHSLQGRDFAVFLFLAATLATLKTMTLLQAGHVYGRLSVPPVYDDVAYFVEGTSLLRSYYEDGMIGVLDRLRTAHSPMAALLAFTGFLIFGIKQSVPYLMNAMPLAISLAIIARLAGFDFVQSGLLLLALLGLPIVDYLITTFHPDLWLGVETGLICMAIFRRRFFQYSHAAVAAIGLLVALAMLTKPTASPATILVILVALGLAFMLEIAETPSTSIREVTSAATKKLLLLFGVVALVAGPYFARNLVSIVEYIHQGLVTERAIWYVERTTAESALYYVRTLRDMLGWSVWLLIALPILNLGVCVWKKRRHVPMRIGGFALVMFLAYLIPTAVSTKTFFFGGLLYGLALCFVVLNLHVFVSLLDAKRRHNVALVILASGAVASLTFARDNQARWPRDAIEEANSMFLGTYPTIKAALEGAGKPGMFGAEKAYEALIPFPFGVAPHAYQFAAQQDGLDMTVVGDPRRSKHEVTRLLETSLIAVLPDSARAKGWATFPLYRHLDEILLDTKRDQRFKLAQTFNTDRGSVFIFTRKFLPPPIHAGAGWLPLEGPYPRWSLPRVRWMTFPGAEITFDSTQRMRGDLVLSCRAGFEGISVEATVQDVFVGQWAVGLDFAELRIPIRVGTDAPLAVQIRLRAAAKDKLAGEVAGERAILCRQARLEVIQSNSEPRTVR